MMGRMLTGPVLPLLPAGAEEIAPGVGVLAEEDAGGLVVVHGLATFARTLGMRRAAAGGGAAGPAPRLYRAKTRSLSLTCRFTLARPPCGIR